ncbi:Enoyl-CoA hydratase/carnithine racemase [Evansella caseinilytica]|uniref:Enoyl-CoA hydratase/carnithine racemase n=1 Tax=Evansella caseinilytica TaxID=1503961 RepID=A0A1H3QQA5_9BACI|nr:Enoyl-CoA hydratase/carnithine racemase [Evansella caseinilytica]
MRWLEASKDGGIAVLTIKRQEAANALSKDLLNELLLQLEAWRWDRTVRAFILTGEGDSVFCAGADLKERRGMNDVQVRQAVRRIRQLIHSVADMPFPMIAAINGAAIGGGLELALACDFRISAESASFALTETSLGIIPGAGGTQRLPRMIGIERAKAMIFTGRKISAKTALEWGLVLKTVPREKVMDEALYLAREISSNGPVAVRQAKFAVDRGMEVDLQSGLAVEEKAYEVTIPTKDRLEGLHAFQAKRPPSFNGE